MKTLRMLKSMWDSLKQHLFRDTPKEGAAVLLCKENRTSQGETLLGHTLVFPEKDDLEVQESAAVGYKKEFQQKLLALCKGEEFHLVACHSHPFSQEGVRFSPIDDQWDQEFCTYTSRCLPGMIHGSLVMGQKSCDARFFDKQSQSLVPLDRIYLVGKGLSQIQLTSSPGTGKTLLDQRYNRQEILLGTLGQKLLSNLKVAIVGLGGTGSHIAQQLAYLGVRFFFLIRSSSVRSVVTRCCSR
jgi:molybdopterin-synthase adenylyltransferase